VAGISHSTYCRICFYYSKTIDVIGGLHPIALNANPEIQGLVQIPLNVVIRGAAAAPARIICLRGVNTAVLGNMGECPSVKERCCSFSTLAGVAMIP
jgi:hypothetical protein